MFIKRTYASESVTEGHPDKICDQISDAILDDILAHNVGPALDQARVACESAVKSQDVFIFGEITSEYEADYAGLARKTIREIGYDSEECGIDPDTCQVWVRVERQSPDIARGTTEENLGAGDQGMMFGYATDETVPEYMPLPIVLAHRLTRRLAAVRKSGQVPYLRPDGKAQVTVEYQQDRPLRVRRVVLASQHRPGPSPEQIHDDLLHQVIAPALGHHFNPEVLCTINGTGQFIIGGPRGDAGLTGRKIMVDTYGGLGRHGGGAFSGKDPTKVDRSANYLCRYVAKNVVAAGLARRCEFHLAYCIGVADPEAIGVETFGTALEGVTDQQIENWIREIFPLRPRDIIRELNLRRPIYRKTAAYGHFGRIDEDFTWERLDKVEALRQAAGLA